MRSVTLATVCEFKPSKRLARTVLSETDAVSFVPMNELGIHRMHLAPHEQRTMSEVIGSYTYFADGDVLLAKITPCFENGKLGVARGLTNGVGFGSSEFMVIRPNDKILPEYLYYFLERDEMRLTGAKIMTGAVGHRRVPQEFIESLEITLPALEEQRRIVALLDEAFAAIDTATANAEKNLANARELFDLASDTLFTQAEVTWGDVPLSEISDFQGGSQPPKSTFVTTPQPGYIRLLQIRDFKSDKAAVYIPESKRNKICRDDDVMIARYGASVGQIHRGKSGAYNVALIRTIPDERKVDKDYFYHFLKSPRFQKPLMAVASRSAQDGFSKEDIAPIRVPLPSAEEQKQLISELMSLNNECAELSDRYKTKLNALVALKQSLLHHAFTGELAATVLDTIAA